MPLKTTVVLVVFMIVFGVVSGLFLSQILSKSQVPQSPSRSAGAAAPTDLKSKTVGSTHPEAFPDSATGTIEAGGLGNEGTHKLIRDGGPSQTVYLVSSVADLDEFIGKKVTVWGQTLKASKAPWLMDVGRIKISD